MKTIDKLSNIVLCKKLMYSGKRLEAHGLTIDDFPHISIKLSEILASWTANFNEQSALAYQPRKRTENKDDPLSAFSLFNNSNIKANEIRSFCSRLIDEQIWLGIGKQVPVPPEYVIMANGQIALSWFIPLWRIW